MKLLPLPHSISPTTETMACSPVSPHRPLQMHLFSNFSHPLSRQPWSPLIRPSSTEGTSKCFLARPPILNGATQPMFQTAHDASPSQIRARTSPSAQILVASARSEE